MNGTTNTQATTVSATTTQRRRRPKKKKEIDLVLSAIYDMTAKDRLRTLLYLSGLTDKAAAKRFGMRVGAVKEALEDPHLVDTLEYRLLELAVSRLESPRE